MTRFKKWKTSFRREVVAGSTRPRQATDKLVEIDQAKSMQGLDDVGSVFDCTRMSVDTLDSPIANGLVKVMNPEFKRRVQVAEELQGRQHFPMMTGRRIVFMIYAFFKINDVQGRVTEHERLAQDRIGQRQSQEVRSVLGRKKL